MTRTGSDYLGALNDDREVWLNGARVSGMTEHPAFASTTRAIARLYDMTHQERFRDVLTYTSPTSGQAVHRAFQIPRTYEDLVARRQALKLWSEATFGFLGRSPDYKAAMWAGFASAPDFFDDGSEHDFAGNVTRHYEFLRENDLFQSHTIVNPQIDKAKAATEQEEDHLFVGVVSQDSEGIVVRGAKMIGTGAMLGDEIQVACIEPLGPNDQDYALSFSVPLSAEGVKVICRRSYAEDATSVYDYPFSTTLDENDALLVYENVFVPWDKVFVYRDVARSFLQWWDTPGFNYMCMHGAIRFWTKLEFLAGVAIKIAKANNTYGLPPVRMALGRLLTWVETLRGMVLGAEAGYEIDANGIVQPSRGITFAYRSLAPQIYPAVIGELKELAGGGVIQLPSSFRDLLTEGEADIVKRYIRSPGHPAEQRIQLFKLAWDVLGSEFGGRHEQYERFYLGPSYVTQADMLRESQPEVCEALVDAALESYSIEDAVAQAGGTVPELHVPTEPRLNRIGAAEGIGLVTGRQTETKEIDRRLPMWKSPA